jgi:hypothetical protein
MFANNPAAQTRPPVPYNAHAIKAGIAHEAANGPSHVRIKALGMMARITGLFEQGKQLGKQLAQETVQSIQPASPGMDALQQAIADGVDLSDFSMYRKKDKQDKQDERDDDDEAANQEDDDVP